MPHSRKIALASVVILAAIAFTQWPRPAAVQANNLPQPEQVETAVFAGGCFWCMESPFEKLDGVVSVESGYTGGHVDNPTYEQVSHTETGHVEAVRITYDPTRIGYQDLLEVFWRQIDPTDAGGQFVDRGNSYVSGIFVNSEAQRDAAQQSKDALQASERFESEIVTPIRDAATFYLAEDYHQDYYKKNPLKYKYYRYRSGRDQFLDQWWGTDRDYQPMEVKARYTKPSDQQIRQQVAELLA
ncbi:MAG: peptide-methionine (S)-S-oxide reductase MsrA, partial [Planctomycetota bacterium]